MLHNSKAANHLQCIRLNHLPVSDLPVLTGCVSACMVSVRTGGIPCKNILVCTARFLLSSGVCSWAGVRVTFRVTPGPTAAMTPAHSAPKRNFSAVALRANLRWPHACCVGKVLACIRCNSSDGMRDTCFLSADENKFPYVAIFVTRAGPPNGEKCGRARRAA